MIEVELAGERIEVRDLIDSHSPTIAPEASLEKALELLRENKPVATQRAA